MTDREKVIKGLEEVQHYVKVENLPAHTLKAKLVIDDAIELLKAQEPVKPLKMAVDYVRKEPVVFSYKCPVCMCGLHRHWVACPICGTGVKWE